MYREFKEAKPFEQPDITPKHRELQALQFAAMQRAKEKEDENTIQNNIKIAAQEGHFPQIQKQINEKVGNAMKIQQDHLRNGGKGINPQVNQLLGEVSMLSKSGKALWDQKQELDKQINEKAAKDPNYDPTYDLETTQKVFDPNISTTEQIGNHLNSVKPGSDVRKTFREEKAISDFVQKQGEADKTYENTDKSGVKTKNEYKGQFFKPNGTPGITEEHVNAAYNHDPRLKEIAYEKAHDQMMDEIAKAKAAGEVWQDRRDLPKDQLINGGEPFNTKDRDAAELFTDVYNNPDINPNAPKIQATDSNGVPIMKNGKPVMMTKTFGNRTFDYTKNQLARYEKTHSQAAIDQGNYDADKGRGITSKVYSVTDDFDQEKHGGPGYVLVNKQKGTQGIPIPIKGIVYSKTSGEQVNTSGNVDLFATSINLGFVQNGKPVDKQFKSVEEMTDFISSLSDDEMPTFKISNIIHGQTYNKKEISVARAKMEALKMKPVKTEEETKQLEAYNNVANNLKNLGEDPDLTPEVLQAALGVKVEDVVKVVDSHTAAQLKGKLGEFDVNSPKNETPEMKAIKKAWDLRVQKFNEDRKVENEQHGGKGVLTPDEFNFKWAKLKSGESLIGPDGKTYTKN